MTRPAIRDALPEDAPRVAAIYNHYVRGSIATFEEEPLTADAMARRMTEKQAGYPFLIAEIDSRVVGYAYAGRWNPRCSYRHTAEASVFLDPEALGRGVGTSLYRELLDRLAEQSIRIVIGGVSLPNPASVALHEKFGFRKVAEFEEVGYKFGRWINVGYWQVKLPA